MQIENDALVSIDYKLTLDNGELVDESSPGDPLSFIYGMGQVVPGLEKELAGQTVGQETRITVEPEEGYGPMQPELVREMARDRFPMEMSIEVGMIFQAETPHGPVNFQVADVTEEIIKADFNHPLAGKRLHFDIRVAEVREATEDDRAALIGGHTGCGDTCSGCGAH
jgi:FKBP-type peptidyl-prolyl cis-trans isomerase SlyD